MIAEIAWWRLRPDDPGVEALRGQIRDDVLDDWRDVPGLHTKAWISLDGLWGAIMVWDGPKPPPDQLPPNSAALAIGRSADVRVSLILEAAVIGRRAGRNSNPHS
jgi:trans-2,3-dihydro-3-hydroxyanthranilate isomerase